MYLWTSPKALCNVNLCSTLYHIYLHHHRVSIYWNTHNIFTNNCRFSYRIIQLQLQNIALFKENFKNINHLLLQYYFFYLKNKKEKKKKHTQQRNPTTIYLFVIYYIHRKSLIWRNKCRLQCFLRYFDFTKFLLLIQKKIKTWFNLFL